MVEKLGSMIKNCPYKINIKIHPKLLTDQHYRQDNFYKISVFVLLYFVFNAKKHNKTEY